MKNKLKFGVLVSCLCAKSKSAFLGGKKVESRFEFADPFNETVADPSNETVADPSNETVDKTVHFQGYKTRQSFDG